MDDVIEAVSALGLEQERPFEVLLVDTATPVDELAAERAAAIAKLSRFARFDDAINECEQARQAANGALQQFLNEEKSRLLSWAESGEGDAPGRDAEAYSRLVLAVEDADRQHAAAVAARATVSPHVDRVRAALHDIQIRIDYRIAHAIAADGVREIEELRAVLDDALVRHARIIACREALHQKAQRYHDANQRDRAGPWGSAAQRLANISNKLAIEPNQGDVQVHLKNWKEKIE